MKQHALGQLDRLRRRALDTDREKLCENCITAANMIIADLEIAGEIDGATALELNRHWVETYSKQRLEAASTHARLMACWQRGDLADFISKEDRARMIGEASRAVADSTGKRT